MPFLRLQRAVLEALRQRVDVGDISERQLARQAGCSQPHLNKILSGKSFASIDRLNKLARLTGAGHPDPPEPRRASDQQLELPYHDDTQHA